MNPIISHLARLDRRSIELNDWPSGSLNEGSLQSQVSSASLLIKDCLSARSDLGSPQGAWVYLNESYLLRLHGANAWVLPKLSNQRYIVR